MEKRINARDKRAQLLLREPDFRRILRQSRQDHETRSFQGAYRAGAFAEAVRARPLQDSLAEAIKWAEVAYTAEWEAVQWYNNNVPGVGQKIDYKSVPAPPAWLQVARIVLANYCDPQKNSIKI